MTTPKICQSVRRLLVAICYLLTVIPGVTLNAQDNWQPHDSIVHVYTVNEQKETLTTGIVFREHEGRTFILTRDLYYGRQNVLPPELTDTAASVSSEVSVILRAGSLATEFIAAQRLYSANQTGLDGYEIIIADAEKMPPPVKFGSTSNLTEGDELSLKGVKADVINNEWIFERATDRLTVEGLFDRSRGGDETPSFLATVKPSSGEDVNGFVFDAVGNCYGEFRSGDSLAGVPPGTGIIGTNQVELVSGIGPYLLTQRGFYERHYDGYTMTADLFFGVSPLTGSPQSIEALYEYTQEYRGISREFDGEPETISLSPVSKDEWASFGFGNPETGEPPEEYPFAELWRATVRVPVRYEFVNWRSIDFRYQFRVEESTERTVVRREDFNPRLAAVTSFKPVDLEGEEPVLLTVDDTIARETSLDRPATVRTFDVETSSLILDQGERGIFPYVHIGLPREKIVEPFVFNDSETHAAIATRRGRIFFADTRTWERLDVGLTVDEGILTLGAWQGDLFVVTRDRSRVLRIDTASGTVLAEIGLPVNFRRGGPDNPGGTVVPIFDTRLVFHPQSQLGFVVSNNNLISIDLENNEATHWVQVGSQPQQLFRSESWRQGQIEFPKFQFSNDGSRLIARGPAGFYRIAIDDRQLTLEKKIEVVSNVDEFAIAGDDTFVGSLEGQFDHPAMTEVSITEFSPVGSPVPVGNDSNGNMASLDSFAFDQDQQILFTYEGGFREEVIAIRNMAGDLVGSISESSSPQLSDRRNSGGNLTFLPATRRLISAGTISSTSIDDQVFYFYDVPEGLSTGEAASALFPEAVTVSKNWLVDRIPDQGGARVELEPVFEEISWPPAWTDDGAFVFFSDHGGTIYKLGTSDWTVVAEFNLGTPFGPLKRCNAGLLAPNPDAGAVLLLDFDLNVIATFNCTRPYHVAASPEAGHFIVGSAEFESDLTMRSTGSRAVNHLTLINVNDGVVWSSPTNFKLIEYLEQRAGGDQENNRTVPWSFRAEHLVMSDDGTRFYCFGGPRHEYTIEQDGITFVRELSNSEGGSNRQYFDPGDGRVSAAGAGRAKVILRMDITDEDGATLEFSERKRSQAISGAPGGGPLAMGHQEGFSFLDRDGSLISTIDFEDGQLYPAFSPTADTVLLMMEDWDDDTRMKFHMLRAFEIE
ncbi:MAG: hypothetical protein AAF456_17330 [Planctomycetota bacterium]